jgi:nucleoid-associated protein YgaU
VKVDPRPVEVLPFRFDPEQFLRQAGTAIWAERERDRGKSVLEYKGVSAHRISLDLFFTALRPTAIQSAARDVEAEVERLHRFALPVVPNDPASEPPKLQIRYGHGQQLRWVIDAVRWNRDDRSPTTGRRVQSQVTVDLVEHTAAKLALSPVEQAQQIPPPQARPGGVEGGVGSANPGATRVYVVRTGDTLTGICARELGSASRLQEVLALNPQIRDPDRIFPGDEIVLPAH